MEFGHSMPCLSITTFNGHWYSYLSSTCIRQTASCQDCTNITRTHSSLWAAEFLAEPWSLPFSAKFSCFKGIIGIWKMNGDWYKTCSKLFSYFISLPAACIVQNTCVLSVNTKHESERLVYLDMATKRAILLAHSRGQTGWVLWPFCAIFQSLSTDSLRT